MVPCKHHDTIIPVLDDKKNFYLAAILKMTATADACTFAGAPISENVYNTSKYMCTKFGAFIKKWTIFCLCRPTRMNQPDCENRCSHSEMIISTHIFARHVSFPLLRCCYEIQAGLVWYIHLTKSLELMLLRLWNKFAGLVWYCNLQVACQIARWIGAWCGH